MSGWTSHGKWYGIDPEPAEGRPDVDSKCGGLSLCRTCRTEAGLPPLGQAVKAEALASLQPTLAETLLCARIAAKLSQQQVADATGIPRSGVSDVERGVREVSALELRAYAELFSTTTDALLGHEPPAPSVHTPEGLMARLEAVTNNLYGYLADRAQELAEPHIQVAEQAAAERVRQAEFQVQRATDLLEETRRQWKADLKRAHRAEHRIGRTHTAGECGTCDQEQLLAMNAEKELGS